MESKEQQVREKILHKSVENPSMSHHDIAKSLGVPRSTVSSVLKRFRDRLTLDRKPGSGGKRNDNFKNQRNAVLRLIKQNPNLSIRDVAKKVKTSYSFVQKVKKAAGYRSFKVIKTPNRNEKQETSSRTRARKLYDKLLTKFDCVVMDDETNVKADFKQLPGLEFYTALQRGKVDEHFKAKKLSKFSKKYMVWQAICSCGLKSKIFITTGTINQQVYVNECLQKRLLPFIQKHTSSVLFWPDLASCHYGKAAQEWYAGNNINIVPKDCNPPNVPELRPIERYWAIVKRNLGKSKGEANNEKDFAKKWENASRKVTEDTVHNLMDGIKRKVRAYGYNKSEK